MYTSFKLTSYCSCCGTCLVDLFLCCLLENHVEMNNFVVNLSNIPWISWNSPTHSKHNNNNNIHSVRKYKRDIHYVLTMNYINHELHQPWTTSACYTHKRIILYSLWSIILIQELAPAKLKADTPQLLQTTISHQKATHVQRHSTSCFAHFVSSCLKHDLSNTKVGKVHLLCSSFWIFLIYNFSFPISSHRRDPHSPDSNTEWCTMTRSM